MHIELKFLGYELLEAFFDGHDVFARCNFGTIRNPENMGVDGDSGMTEGRIQDDVCGFTTDSG